MSSTAYTAAKLAFFDALSGTAELSPLDVRVAWRILHHLNEKFGYSWPSVERLAREACCSERSVQYAVRHLVQEGWFEIVPGSGGGRKQTNRYIPCLARGRGSRAKGAVDCTLSKEAEAGAAPFRVQIAAETVQASEKNGAPGCTQTLYDKSSPESFAPGYSQFLPARGLRRSTDPARDDRSVRSGSSPSYGSGEGSQSKKAVLWQPRGRAIPPRNLHGEIVERLVQGLNLSPGEAWMVLMRLSDDPDSLSWLERQQEANSLQDSDLLDAVRPRMA